MLNTYWRETLRLPILWKSFQDQTPIKESLCYSSLKMMYMIKLTCKIQSATHNTIKPVLSNHSKRTQKLFFNRDNWLMQVKSIAECPKGSILQYFRPSLSYNFPLRPLFCLFLSGRSRQNLLYMLKVILPDILRCKAYSDTHVLC